ncbi:OsmC family protein [Alsobacter sp. SYSU M60028]|uniref:OsmC family protein n=1 Tax=Alsobacter ponti TaxID=2962936 RepID=A0ABT1L969_9HYPH|nr:OsmC family protein [Alsobacter ponti]MCP8938014.1 OsmC family protein [Alsobacter ponti]
MTERGVLPVDPALLTPVTMRVSADGRGYAHSVVRVRGHAVQIDEPPERGGGDLGPAPTEMFLCSLAGVTNVILRRLGARDGVAIRHVGVELEAVLDRRGVWLAEPVDLPWIEVRLRVAVDSDADDARLAVWREDLPRFSPLHTLLRQAGTRIVETWTRAGA